MQKTRTLLAAALLSLVAIAGNSPAQTQTPTPSPTPTPTADVALGNASFALKAAQNWSGLLALAQPLVTSVYVYSPSMLGLSDQQFQNNLAIQLVEFATAKTSGASAQHAYAAQEQDYMGAAAISFGPLHNAAQAATESGKAITASAPADADWRALNLLYQCKAGQSGNAQLLAFLQAQTALSIVTGQALYDAFNKIGATKADLLTFYQLLYQGVENTAGNNAFVAKVGNEIDKLNAEK